MHRRHTEVPVHSLLTVALAASAFLGAVPAANAGNPSGVSLSMPGVAAKNDVIRVKVEATGASEGIWFHASGLEFQRGWFDQCGWCGKACLVSDVIQDCPSPPDGCCFSGYCLSCAWSASHEWNAGDPAVWYGTPTWEFKVTGCDTATLQAEYYGGSHEGPFLLPEREIVILDGIEASFEAWPDDVCVGEPVTFDASGTCGGTDFAWSFGDGATGNGRITTHVYDQPGTYNVLLNVTSPRDGDQATGLVQVTGDCATLEGQVTDIADGSALPGATVVADSVPHQRAVRAGTDGAYTMKVPPNHTYTVRASRSGYEDSAPATASPGPDETVTLDFALFETVTDPIDPLAVLGGQWVNIGDPVNPATGNFTMSRRLLTMPGRRSLGIDLRLTYNSLDAAGDGPLGYGWTHTYDIWLDVSGDDATLKLGDGSRRFFHRDAGSGEWVAANCRAEGVLADRSPDGWTYSLPGGRIYQFDADGRIESLCDLVGAAIIFTHTTRLDRITDASGRHVDLTYAGGRLVAVIRADAPGPAAQLAYDGAGDLTSITDALGHSWSFTYDGQHRLLTETDRRGVLVLTNAYDADGRIVSQTDALGQVTTFAATPMGDRIEVAITPPSGHAVTHVYDAAHNLLRATDGEGHTASFAYDANGYPASATDKLGRVMEFSFAANGLLTGATDRLGGTLTLTHDANGFLAYSQDDLGNVIEASRKPTGDIEYFSNPDGGGSRFWTDWQGRVTLMTDLNGRVWQLQHGSDGLVSSTTDPDGNVTAYTRDAAGRVTRVDLPDGLGSLTMTWDELGSLTSVTSPGGQTTTFTHDEEGNVTGRTFEPTAAVTAYAYDALNRLATVTDPLGGVTAYAYDADSNLVGLTDGDGFTTTYEYNARNELVAVTAPSGARTAYAYDPNGRLTRTTDAAAGVWETTYDAEGRPTSSTDPAGRTTELVFAPNDRDLTVIDPDGGRTLLRFNRMGDLITTVQRDGTIIEQPRSTSGSLTRRLDGRGHVWTYGYDRLGRLETLTDPNGRTESFSYDPLGRRVLLELRSGGHVVTDYDADGRVTGIHPPDGADIALDYDFGPDGVTLTVTEPVGVSVVRYDLLGRFVGKTDPFGASIALEYTPGGRLAKVTYPGSLEVLYAYDGGGRLATITDWLGNVTRYHYDAADRVVRVELPNGTEVHSAYDAAGRLESLSHKGPGGGVLVGHDIVRDDLGRVASVTTTGLAPATLGDGLRESSYDPANRTVAGSTDLQRSTYVFDADGRQVARKTGADEIVYAYDGLGRLTSLAGGGHLTIYDVDWEGSRVRRVHDGDEVRWLRRDNQVWAATDGAGAPLRRYVWGPGGLLYAVDATGEVRVLHADPVGSVVATSDGSGGVIARTSYDPYGRVVGETGGGVGELGYLGAWGVISDADGLLQTGQRMYDPEDRRFLTEDPLGLAGSLNLYAYTTGDPVNSFDPSGLEPWTRATVDQMERWLKDGYKLGWRDAGELLPSPAMKIDGVRYDQNSLAGHLRQNWSLPQIVDQIVDENALAKGPPPPKTPVTPKRTFKPRPPAPPTTAAPPPPAAGLPPAAGGGQQGFWTRMYSGARGRVKEILGSLSTIYTVTRSIATTEAAQVAALGPEGSVLLPAVWGGVTGRLSSAYIPVTFNETTGRWETADQVVTNYFLPNQLAAYQTKDEDYLWFGDFQKSLRYILGDGLKPGVPVK